MIELIFATLGPILTKLIPDVNARASALEDLHKTLVAQETAIVASMQAVMTADAASEGWLTRNARPIVVMWSLGMITWVTMSPMFGLQQATISALAGVPDALWNLVSVGIGGYVLARSVDKGIAAWKSK